MIDGLNMKELALIHGLKLAFTGAEIVRALDDRLEAHRAAIQLRRNEIDGTIEIPPGALTQVPAETVEEEIRQLEIRVQKLALCRERILPAETYLLGRKAVKFAGLLPSPPPPVPDIDLEKGIRWVTRVCE